MRKLLIGILLMAMLIPSALADIVTIDVDMNGDADVTIENYGDGEFILIYNGRDILQELLDAQKSITDFQKLVIYQSTQQQFYETQLQFNEISLELGEINDYLLRLTEDLNGVLGDIYAKLTFTMHVIGINPGASSVAEALISGNVTVADYLDDLLTRVGVLEVGISEVSYLIAALDEIDGALSDQITALTVQQGNILEVIVTLNQRLDESEGKIQSLEEQFGQLQLSYDDLHIFNGVLADDNHALEQRIVSLEEDADIMVLFLCLSASVIGVIAIALASQGLLKFRI